MPVLHLKKRAIVPASGPAQPPPVPVAITFAPASPIILDNAPNGTLVATISVTMSPVALFTGVLSFAAPFNNDGGLFTIAGSNLIVAATLPAGNSTQNITVSATQNGVTMTQSLAIQVQQHSAGTGATLTTFQLTSPNSGLQPFTIGIALKKGATLGPISLDQTNTQVIIKRTWNDGSVKHAIASGFANLVANTPLMVKVLDQGGSSGAALTSSDIAAANPSATVSLGTLGFVPLSLLLASAPVRTFLSGPQMVECHYQAVVSNLLVSFHVRLYLGGRVWIRACVDNGWVDIANSDAIYTATITIGGATVYSNTFISTAPHYAHTRYEAEGWIGGDPQITPAHNVPDLVATKLVPNYFVTPSAAQLNALTQTYTPFNPADITPNMPDTGNQTQIGVLPLWDALYIQSGGDSRAYNSVIANAKAVNSYAIVWRGSADNALPMRPSIYPNYTVAGNFGGGGAVPAAGPLQWDCCHSGSSGYLAYILTGEYFHIETCAHQAGAGYLTVTFSNSFFAAPSGSGTTRNLFSGTVRCPAWNQRNIGQYAAIAPTGDLVGIDMTALMTTQANNAVTLLSSPNWNQLGILYEYDAFGAGSFVNSLGPNQTQIWMDEFWVMTYGHLSDIEALGTSGMTALNTARDYQYKIPVGKFGDTTNNDFCFSDAGFGPNSNVFTVANPTDLTTANVRANWGAVFTAMVGDGDFTASCPTSLVNNIHWQYSVPALAFATDHNATGVSGQWTRLTSAPTWTTGPLATVFNGDTGTRFGPIWAIGPRDKMLVQLGTVAAGQWTGDLIAANGGRHYFDPPFVAVGASNFTTYYAHTPANGTPTAGTNSWAFSSGALVYDQNKYIHTGGGHTDGLNSEVEYLDFANLTWVFSDDSAQLDTSADPGAPFNPSGTPPSWFPWPNKSGRRTPTACHQYGGTVYMQGTGLVQVLGAFRTPDASGGPGGAMCINTSTGQWTTANTSAFAALGGGQVAEWIPATQGSGNHLGRVFRLDGNPTAYLYDPATNTWEQCGTFVSAVNDFHHNGCIVPDPFNPGFSAYITVAGASPTTQCFVASKVDVSPSPQLAFAYKSFANTAPSLTGSTWIYMGNGANGRGSSQVVVWDGAANVSQLYILDISTYAWSGPFAISGTAPSNTSASGGQATYHRFFYHPKYDCFCWIDGATGSGGNLYAFKRPSSVT